MDLLSFLFEVFWGIMFCSRRECTLVALRICLVIFMNIMIHHHRDVRVHPMHLTMIVACSKWLGITLICKVLTPPKRFMESRVQISRQGLLNLPLLSGQKHLTQSPLLVIGIWINAAFWRILSKRANLYTHPHLYLP